MKSEIWILLGLSEQLIDAVFAFISRTVVCAH